MNVTITGYPNEQPYQYFHSGTVVVPQEAVGYDFDYEYVMLYYIDTLDGQSGSPVYYQADNGDWISPGIHTTDYTYIDGNGQKKAYFNQGSRFTGQLFSFTLAYTSAH